jgi:xanthine dehydrogenase accessory factor
MNNILMRTAELLREGRSFALATVVGTEDSAPGILGVRMIVHPDGSSEGTVGGGALEKMVAGDAVDLLKRGGTGGGTGGKTERRTYDLGKGEEGTPVGMICGGKADLLIEVFGREMKLFIFGAGHIGRVLSRLCGVLGISHWVVDDREEYAVREVFPDAGEVVRAEFDESFAGLPIDDRSYLVIVTYAHRHDGVCLRRALRTPAAYIGMIGSRKKVRTLLETLVKEGVPVEDDRIHAPIGLQLGDGSPGQIGISILAEILALHSGGSALHMREIKGR